VFWSFLAKTAPNQPRSKNFALIMRAMTAASSSYARAGYEAIVDFSIPPWFLDTARVVLKRAPKEYAVHYVVLRPSEAVCALRAASRATGTILDYAPYRELYAAFDAAEQYTIGDDSDDARALAARIRAGLAAGNFRLI
jgi:hypothetical protein